MILKVICIYFIDNGGKNILIVAKIENVHGIYRIDEIIAIADAVMLMRSTLSFAVPMEKLFLVQKSVTAKCNKVIN